MDMSADRETHSEPSRVRRVLLHWVVRLVLLVALTLLLALVFGFVAILLVGAIDEFLAIELGSTIAVGCALALVTLLIERRGLAAIGMGARGLLPQWLRGFALGAAFMLACVGVLALLGGYRVAALRFAAGPLLIAFLTQLFVGLFEEGLFRGVFFRLFEEGLGSWVALVVSAAFFGAVHLANPQATAWGAAAIAIEAGLFLGAAYMATRSLWFVAGIHTAWNFFQGAIFGITVSGTGPVEDSLLVPRIAGPELLTGGVFGIEASLIAVLGGLALAAWFAALAVRRGRTLRPLLWRGGINRLPEQAESALL